MDDNVMKKYTTKSTEASHFIQYDQGEHTFPHLLLLHIKAQTCISKPCDNIDCSIMFLN